MSSKKGREVSDHVLRMEMEQKMTEEERIVFIILSSFMYRLLQGWHRLPKWQKRNMHLPKVTLFSTKSKLQIEKQLLNQNPQMKQMYRFTGVNEV